MSARAEKPLDSVTSGSAGTSAAGGMVNQESHEAFGSVLEKTPLGGVLGRLACRRQAAWFRCLLFGFDRRGLIPAMGI